MINNYFFIDGSALFAQIKTLQKRRKRFKGRKLDPARYIQYLSLNLQDLGVDQFKRAVFYFPQGDTRPNDHLVIPDIEEPGLIRDVGFKYCGEKIKGSKAFDKFVEEKVPKRWRDRCDKSEKGIDIEICCDAFKLAARGNLERLLLFTNDRDFVPLCKALKDFGVNVSLIHLSTTTNVNKALVSECDTYDVVREENLDDLFVPLPSK